MALEAYPVPTLPEVRVPDKLKARNLANLALKAVRAKAEDHRESTTLAHQLQIETERRAKEAATASATPLIDTLSESKLLDYHGNIRASRTMSDGRRFSLSYQEMPRYNEKTGKALVQNPNFASWQLMVDGGETAQEFSLRLGSASQKDFLAVSKIERARKRGREDVKKTEVLDPASLVKVSEALNALTHGLSTGETERSADQTRHRQFSMSTAEVVRARAEVLKSSRTSKRAELAHAA